MRLMSMLSKTVIAVSLCLLVWIWSGCGGESAPDAVAMDPAELERWEIALVEWRIEKNEDFMEPAKTPLPATLQQGFEGLDYYFPEAGFRYRLTLQREARPDTVMLTKRKGQEVPYVVAGTLRFQHDDSAHELVVFSSTAPGPESLFLPFYDLTNGESTYPGGRYVDLESAADGQYELDFNKAYNPLCAYDTEAWNCILPPPENRLPFRVEAGEKLLAAGQH